MEKRKIPTPRRESNPRTLTVQPAALTFQSMKQAENKKSSGLKPLAAIAHVHLPSSNNHVLKRNI
jgi:hypothetical protein